MRNILNKRFLFPFKIAVLAGILSSLSFCHTALRQHEYLRYHLYNTAARVCAAEINRRVLICLVVLYGLWLIYTVGSNLKGRLRTAWQALILISVLAAVAVKLGAKEWVKDFGATLTYISTGDMLSQVLAAVICAILGIVALVVMRRSSGKSAAKQEMSGAPNELVVKTRRLVLAIERQSAFWGVPVALVLVLNIAALALSSGAVVSARSRPNVVILMIDTLRADHVGAYGYSRNTTPNLDRLAKESVFFKKAVANSSWTTASVSSFMSSQYPQTTLYPGDADALDEFGQPLSDIRSQCVTIAEALDDRGYATGAVVANPQYGASRGGQRGFDFFREVERDDVTREANDWIGRNKDKRLFFFGLYLGPHTPYLMYPDFNFDPGYKGNFTLTNNRLGNEKMWPTNPRDVMHIKAAYDSSLAYTDHQIGILLDRLKKEKLYDDSIIIVLADHGEEFLDHGGFFHGHKLYRELLHVPLMIKLPKQTEGKTMNNPFPLVNLFPTLLSALKMDPSSIQGKGISVDLAAAERSRDDYLYSVTDLGVELRSVQNQRYKYILDMRKGKGMLFDIAQDPLEKSDIAAREPELVDRLKEYILSMEIKARANGFADSAPPEKKLSNEEKEKLRSLGYLQ